MARGEIFDYWLREFVCGPNYVVKSYPKYCARGYAFAIHKEVVLGQKL